MKVSTINIQPLGDQIVVLPENQQEKSTASGIIVYLKPVQDAPTVGEVVVLGTGGKDRYGDEIKFEFKVGDKVLFKQFVATEYEWNMKPVLILSKNDVLAIIRQ